MKKVLVVDDEYTIRELVDFTLGQDYEVMKAETGKQAMDMLTEKPDLLILDIMMPQMDGYEVCKKIKENPQTKHIPVIILTAKHGVDDLKEAIKVEVDEYITKPFEPELLKKRVDEYLSNGQKKTKSRLFQLGKSMHYIK